MKTKLSLLLAAPVLVLAASVASHGQEAAITAAPPAGATNSGVNNNSYDGAA